MVSLRNSTDVHRSKADVRTRGSSVEVRTRCPVYGIGKCASRLGNYLRMASTDTKPRYGQRPTIKGHVDKRRQTSPPPEDTSHTYEHRDKGVERGRSDHPLGIGLLAMLIVLGFFLWSVQPRSLALVRAFILGSWLIESFLHKCAHDRTAKATV